MNVLSAQRQIGALVNTSTKLLQRNGLGPELRRERLVVRHQRGQHDEDDRREKGDGRGDQQAVVRDRDQEPAAAHRAAASAGRRRGLASTVGRAHRAAPW